MYKFDPTTGLFYPYSMRAEYEIQGRWPQHGTDVSDDDFEQFRLNPPPVGQIVGADDNGMPCWIDSPPKTVEELSTEASATIDGLLRMAAIRIAPLQDAVDIGEATTAEEQQLLAWKKYRVALNRITEQQGFPTAIEWPDVPSV